MKSPVQPNVDECQDGHKNPLQSGFQLTVIDLFWLLAFAALLSLAYSTRWVTTPGFLIVLAFSLVVGVMFVWMRGISWLVAGIVLTVTVAGAVSSPVILWVFGVHFLAGLVVPRRIKSVRNLGRVSMVGIVAVLMIWSSQHPWGYRQFLEARSRYPLEDLAPRLAYEDRSTAGSETVSTETVSNDILSSEVANELTRFETWTQEVERFYGRNVSLERFHSEQYERFVRSPGFGAVRMGPMSLARVETPELSLIAFTDTPSEEVTNNSGDDSFQEWLRHLIDIEDVLESERDDPRRFHGARKADFLHPMTFGYRKSLAEVAGFLPHAFHFVPGELYVSDAEWKLKRLELVSLLKFDGPKVYVLEHLPRMDQLNGEIPVREMNEFESRALVNLQTEQDCVIEEAHETIRMLGSLRASSNCLECHLVERGDLLGAFSYEFEKISK